ncbi:adenosine receptor A1-like [Oculina patagonica]
MIAFVVKVHTTDGCKGRTGPITLARATVSKEVMNSSAASPSGTIPAECVMYNLLGGKLDDTTTEAYAVLVFLIVCAIITCPLTTLFNVLVIVAVKTKPRLKTKSNIVLGCLAVTDGLTGVISQPWFVAMRISTLKGDTSEEYCFLEKLTRNIIRLFCAASITHLVLMSVERYLAIRHSFVYTTMVTKARILASSALAWIITLAATIPLVITDNEMYLTTNNTFLALWGAIIISCQIAVYVEVRRHQKQIASHQVSVEARRKFLKEKKALKLTTCVILILLLSYLPIFFVRILLVTSTISGVNTSYICFYTASFVTILNSLMNPVIYCVRMRQFRVAFTEILLRKSYTDAYAEHFKLRVFGTLLNTVTPLEATAATTTSN